MVLGSQGCKPLVEGKAKRNRGAMALAGVMPSLRDFMGRFFSDQGFAPLAIKCHSSAVDRCTPKNDDVLEVQEPAQAQNPTTPKIEQPRLVPNGTYLEAKRTRIES